MTIDSNYELPPANDFDDDEDSIEPDNDIADFELNVSSSEEKNSKYNSKRSFLAKQRIEQLQEERRLRKLEEDYYDDWD